jgi:TRAP-type C4-dicarboxylate transport system permease small subunit
MRSFSHLVDASLSRVRRVVNGVVVVVFAAIVLVVFSQVVSRFVFNAPFSWSEELARYLQVWLILLTSAAVLRKGLHLAVDYAIHALPPPAKRFLRIVNLGFIVFFLVVVMVSGGMLIAATVSQKTPALQLPMWLVYLALPVGGFLMLLEATALLLKETISMEAD